MRHITTYAIADTHISDDTHRQHITAHIHYDGPFSDPTYPVTHVFARDRYGHVHHTTSTGGYLGILAAPERYGPTLDADWLTAYLDTRAKRAHTL